MQKVTIETPAVYGDHHVLEVRQRLLSLSGVNDVYASSCFHLVEVEFDPGLVTEEKIRDTIGEAGYLEDLAVLAESGPQSPKRQSSGYDHLRGAVSFSQAVEPRERSSWPCPGMGILKSEGNLDA